MAGMKGMLTLMVAGVAVLLAAGCMSGPIPLSSRAGDSGANAPGPSEEKLPAAPAVRSSPP